MNASEQKAVEEIRGAYVQKEESGLDRLRRLDRAARRPAQIFAYVFGAAGTLVLGTGMCLAMQPVHLPRVAGAPPQKICAARPRTERRTARRGIKAPHGEKFACVFSNAIAFRLPIWYTAL